jgi:hypothetical protein
MISIAGRGAIWRADCRIKTANRSGMMSAPPKLAAWHNGQSAESSERLFDGAFVVGSMGTCALLTIVEAADRTGLPWM